ncbi:ELKS/Rab6-interacting/CAST family member 1 [Garra rufa]|uniref:ELKS/Rab6-interacting/CAST family member 1 n=1 Tax=Garra rufa TaxID=137080 RepID=UPI003CCEACB4
MYGSARSVGKVEGNHSSGSNQSPGRSPRLPRSPRLGHRRTNSTGGSGAGAGGPGGKTLSMENIQSLNAAYATSGPMYMSDNEVVTSGPDLPKSTMTLGRSGGRVPYSVRTTVMGSSPNISTGAPGSVPTDAIAFGDHHMPSTLASTVPHSLRQARDNTIMDLQAQLKEVLRENELLRKEVDVKESKLSSSMNSIKTFWSPELKKERALRKDEASKISVWKEQYRVVQDENQIENLQEQLKDKEKQMTSLKERVKSLQADTSNTDTALTTLEEALAEKERIIERLKDQRDRDEREKGEELDSSKKELKELKEKVSVLQGELSDREASLLDLKEHASSLASSGLKKDSKLKSLEISFEQKKEECTKLESQLKKRSELMSGHPFNLAHSVAVEAHANAGLAERIATLEQEVARYKEDAGKAQAEVDRLLEILREMENEKNDKDRKISELESLLSRQMKDQTKKVANLKHKEQVEKSKNAQLMEEARKREDNINESSQQVKDSLQQKDERIEELEEALRESVQITAEREMVLAQEESARANAEKQMEELLAAMEKVKQELESMKAKLSSTQQSLAEKEAHLTTLRAERRKHLEEVLEMKQEALLAAISEKDANIALLELSSSKKKKTQDEVALLKREKDRLVHQLKQQTQNRMKLMADNYEDDHLKASNSDQTNHKPSPDQIIPPLIDLNQNRSKLKLYIGHLTALCHERDPHILQDLAPPSAYHRSQQDAWEEELQKMSPEQLESELEQCERESAELQEYANSVLQQIADHCPDILEQVVNALEESC